jgi:hypothetical protein
MDYSGDSITLLDSEVQHTPAMTSMRIVKAAITEQEQQSEFFELFNKTSSPKHDQLLRKIKAAVKSFEERNELSDDDDDHSQVSQSGSSGQLDSIDESLMQETRHEYVRWCRVNSEHPCRDGHRTWLKDIHGSGSKAPPTRFNVMPNGGNDALGLYRVMPGIITKVDRSTSKPISGLVATVVNAPMQEQQDLLYNAATELIHRKASELLVSMLFYAADFPEMLHALTTVPNVSQALLCVVHDHSRARIMGSAEQLAASVRGVLELKPELQQGFFQISMRELWAAGQMGSSLTFETKLSFCRTVVESISPGLADQEASELAITLLSWSLQIGQLPVEAATWACEALSSCMMHRTNAKLPCNSSSWKIFVV